MFYNIYFVLAPLMSFGGVKKCGYKGFSPTFIPAFSACLLWL
ncbi:unknown [Prevotella sp. CAG:485]|nr:unknown [Prevotella sp. CAG:485]